MHLSIGCAKLEPNDCTNLFESKGQTKNSSTDKRNNNVSKYF